MKPLTVPSTGLFRLALRLTCSTFLQTDLSLNLCSNCKLFSSPSLRTLAQRHRQNGEILVSDLNPRASVLRRSSSTCATRTLNRQGCKSASGTRNPHHQSFSNFDAPHRQPVHLYNGSPGLQRQLLTPIREVKTHPTPSHLTGAAQLWNGKSSFTIAAIAAGALVLPLQIHSPPPFSLGNLSHHQSDFLWWPVWILSAPTGKTTTRLASQPQIWWVPFPLQTHFHFHLLVIYTLPLSSTQLAFFTEVNRIGRIPSGKPVTRLPILPHL